MSTKRRSKKSEKPTAWSEWAWDAGRNQWGRYRMFRDEYEYEWRDPEPSASSTSKLEKITSTDWSEWAWDAGRSQWERHRVFQGKDEYEWRDPEPSASSTSVPEEKDKGEGEGKGKGKGEEKKKNGKLSVEIYRPRWGNLRHWALHLDTGNETSNYVYEVVGEAMHFTAEAKPDIIPSSSGSWMESILVAEIHPDDIAALHRIITNTPVQNDVQGWCCQDYVIEALEGLNEEQIVDDDDFGVAKRRLMKRFNE